MIMLVLLCSSTASSSNLLDKLEELSKAIDDLSDQLDELEQENAIVGWPPRQNFFSCGPIGRGTIFGTRNSFLSPPKYSIPKPTKYSLLGLNGEASATHPKPIKFPGKISFPRSNDNGPTPGGTIFKPEKINISKANIITKVDLGAVSIQIPTPKNRSLTWRWSNNEIMNPAELRIRTDATSTRLSATVRPSIYEVGEMKSSSNFTRNFD